MQDLLNEYGSSIFTCIAVLFSAIAMVLGAGLISDYEMNFLSSVIGMI